jgi:hypothetical protein
LAFDPQGRLWAATADITDRGQDGLYVVPAAGAQPTEVVAGGHTPLGSLWYDGSLYDSSAGRVDAFSQFDVHKVPTPPDDPQRSRAGRVQPTGPVARRRLVMGISDTRDHCEPASTWSATVVSFRPDGSDLHVDASGIRARVGLAFYPQTPDLFVTMNQRDDLGARAPGDWPAVVRQAQEWGFPGCYGQGGPACAGVQRPTAVLDKHAAVSGVAMGNRPAGSEARRLCARR